MYDAGVIWIGTSFMEIPPGEAHHEETGACYGDCTSRRMSENVYVTLAMNHMHYLGKTARPVYLITVPQRTNTRYSANLESDLLSSSINT